MFNSYFNFWYISAVAMSVFIASLVFIVILIIRFGPLVWLWLMNSKDDTKLFYSDEEDKKSLLQ